MGSPIYQSTMRMLIVLIALLSGLSVPQAVAAASGRVDAVAVTHEGLTASPAATCCAVRRSLLHPRAVRPVAIEVPAPAFAMPAPFRTFQFGERARE